MSGRRRPTQSEQESAANGTVGASADISKALESRAESADREMKDREAFVQKARAGRTLPPR